jgi:glycosyltransferase involved in cell wall biosynthesis
MMNTNKLMILFIGSNLQSGIGQVTFTLSKLIKDSKYIQFGEHIFEMYDACFCFIIPTPETIQYAKYYKAFCKRTIYMTVCETETVHEYYGRLFELSDTFYTPSLFSANILKRQFPDGDFKVLHHYASPAKAISNIQWNIPNDGYIFYHIGNVIDIRKNISGIISAFTTLNLPKCYLVLKASCNRHVELNLPNIFVINDRLTQEEMETLHSKCDCYVSFSHSEGAGMGAIEAAIRNKPVIITEYGASTEYIDTPYIIPCDMTRVGVDDFLFKKDMLWGDPDFESLVRYMKHAYENNVRFSESKKTHEIMQRVPGDLHSTIFQQ